MQMTKEEKARAARYYKTVILWPLVTDEVNRRLGTDYTRNYVANVWSKTHRSEKVYNTIKDILNGR